MPSRPSGPARSSRSCDTGRRARHHCQAQLQREPRSGWHIDHFPVAYRDIEDQVLRRARRGPRNLVVSCPACNMSHAHERDVCLGHTQCRCRRQWAQTASLAALSLTVWLGGTLLCRPRVASQNLA